MNMVTKLVKKNFANRHEANHREAGEPGRDRRKDLVDIKLNKSRLAFPLRLIISLNSGCRIFAPATQEFLPAFGSGQVELTG